MLTKLRAFLTRFDVVTCRISFVDEQMELPFTSKSKDTSDPPIELNSLPWRRWFLDQM